MSKFIEKFPGDLISGMVCDDEGKPVIGAEISVKGTLVKSLTNESGRFSLLYESGASQFTISASGYETCSIAIAYGLNCNIVLKKCSRDSTTSLIKYFPFFYRRAMF